MSSKIGWNSMWIHGIIESAVPYNLRYYRIGLYMIKLLTGHLDLREPHFIMYIWKKNKKYKLKKSNIQQHINKLMRRRGSDRMVVGFTTICAISAYHHWSRMFEPRSWWGMLDTTLCDKVCQWLVTGWSVSQGTPVSSINKTDRHNIAEILLKVALSTINQPKPSIIWSSL
jgi:hypothetical protein